MIKRAELWQFTKLPQATPGQRNQIDQFAQMFLAAVRYPNGGRPENWEHTDLGQPAIGWIQKPAIASREAAGLCAAFRVHSDPTRPYAVPT